MPNHHTTDPICPLCVEKLTSVHERLQNWFWDVKREFPDLHISCGWRGREDQEKAFTEGKSKATWPYSKHNRETNGRPCALALDVFQLQEGLAKFRHRYFREIHLFNEEQGFRIIWGGKFRSIRDSVHFELPEEVADDHQIIVDRYERQKGKWDLA